MRKVMRKVEDEVGKVITYSFDKNRRKDMNYLFSIAKDIEETANDKGTILLDNRSVLSKTENGSLFMLVNGDGVIGFIGKVTNKETSDIIKRYVFLKYISSNHISIEYD